MKKLLDVGEPQGLITIAHWGELAKSVDGVYARCGNGNNPPDKTFESNVNGAHCVLLPIGAYAVGLPLPNDAAHPGRDARSQALAHYDASARIDSCPVRLPPVLDLEWPMPVDWAKWRVTASSARGWALEYLDASSRLHRVDPILYLYPDFALHLFAGATPAELAEFARYRLWLARYGVQAPGTVSPWAKPTLWQKSDGGGRLPSNAPVDEDLFLGDDDAWTAFLAA